MWLCVYSSWIGYLLEVLKIDLHSKVYYGVRVNCLGEGRNWRWMAKELINQLICLYILIQFYLCFDCDWQAVIARAMSKIYNEKNAQYYKAANWDRYNFHRLCEFKKEFYKSFDQATSKKAGEWNIEGDRIHTQPLWMEIPWMIFNGKRSHNWSW